MTYHTTQLYGSNSGTKEGPDTVGNTIAVTYITGYPGTNNDRVYGIELQWGTLASRLYGQTSGTPATLDCTSDPVCEVKLFVDSTSGYLQGVKFKTVSNAILSIGYLDGTAKQTAFSDIDNVLTNLITYRESAEIIGIKFRYTGPEAAARIPRELALPALATLAQTVVVVKSLMKVGHLRRHLAIKAPSCDPPLTTSPSDAQLWYRTFRAQENCKETFLIYLPSILIASTLGYHAFGKWAPRAVGTLTFASAFFRYKYLTAYIEDADKRGKPFYYSHLCMRPVFLLAVISSGYLLGKELYHFIMGCKKSCNSEEDD